MQKSDALPPEGPYDCQACGACCVVAGKVSVTPEDSTPKRMVTGGFLKRHLGGRCQALEGTIGACVGCTIYRKRPSVCVSFAAGSEGCRYAREVASYAIKSGGRRGFGDNWRETV